jgi:hypothetical protein
MAHLNEAIDGVRREEAPHAAAARRATSAQERSLVPAQTRASLTQKQRGRLKGLLGLNLRSVRAYLL